MRHFYGLQFLNKRVKSFVKLSMVNALSSLKRGSLKITLVQSLSDELLNTIVYREDESLHTFHDTFHRQNFGPSWAPRPRQNEHFFYMHRLFIYRCDSISILHINPIPAGGGPWDPPPLKYFGDNLKKANKFRNVFLHRCL